MTDVGMIEPMTDDTAAMAEPSRAHRRSGMTSNGCRTPCRRSGLEAVRRADGGASSPRTTTKSKIAIVQNRTVLIQVEFALATRAKV